MSYEKFTTICTIIGWCLLGIGLIWKIYDGYKNIKK